MTVILEPEELYGNLGFTNEVKAKEFEQSSGRAVIVIPSNVNGMIGSPVGLMSQLKHISY